MVNLVTAIVLILFAAFSRLMPHPANFTPVAAIALFSGTYFNKKYMFILPVAAMFISDLILGFHSTMIWVYGSFVLISFIGLWLRSRKKVGYVIGTALFSSILFFVLTNLGVWLTGYYGLTFNGLIECYTMAIPFFRNSLTGDIFYVAVLFGIYELVSRYSKSGETIKVK
jgi:hypothetical protein